MLDIAILLTQILMLALIAAWLTTGVRDNILFPSQNETFTAEVLTMARLKADYPDFYDQLAHRVVTSRARQIAMFRLAVAGELLVTCALWVSVSLMTLALFGALPLDFSKGVSILATAGFIAIWGGFLVVGNHFAYWFGHEGAQNTHYQMVLWGFGVLLLLALA